MGIHLNGKDNNFFVFNKKVGDKKAKTEDNSAKKEEKNETQNENTNTCEESISWLSLDYNLLNTVNNLNINKFKDVKTDNAIPEPLITPHKPENPLADTTGINYDDEVQNFIDNTLDGMSFDSEEEFMKACGEYYVNLSVEVASENDEYINYNVKNSDAEGASAAITVKKATITEETANAVEADDTTSTGGAGETGNTVEADETSSSGGAEEAEEARKAEEAAKELERRNGVVNDKLSECKNALAQYEGAAQRFENDSRVKDAISAYLEDNDEDALNDTLVSVKDEIIAAEEQKIEDAVKAENNHSTGVQDIDEVLESYAKELQQFEGAVKEFYENKKVTNVVNDYKNGLCEYDEFIEILNNVKREITVNNSLDSIKDEENPEVYAKKFLEILNNSFDELKENYPDYAPNNIEWFNENIQDMEIVDYYLEDNDKDYFKENVMELYNDCIYNILSDVKYHKVVNPIKKEYEKQLDELSSDAVKTFRDKSNRILSKYYNQEIYKQELESSLKTLFEDVYYAFSDHEEISETSDGKIVKKYHNNHISEQIKYDVNNEEVSRDTYTYNEDGSYNVVTKVNGRVQVVYDYNSKNELISRIKYRYNSDGSYTTYTYNTSTKASVTTYYDTQGNQLPSGEERVKGKGKISKTQYGFTVTLSTWQVYYAISRDLDRTLTQVGGFYSISTRDAVEMITGGSLTNTFLEAAQPNNTLKGATRKYNHISQCGYEGIVRQMLLDSVGKNYGYEPDDVTGYLFDSNSDLAKMMASDKDTIAFVKKHLNDLISGNFRKSYAFESNKDLYYSIHGIDVIDAQLDGTVLTLKLFDIYDFEPSYIDKLSNSSGGSDLLNAAGAAAMLDGKLVPYYFITEVKIDLRSLGLM